MRVQAFVFSLVWLCYFHQDCCAQLPATRAAVPAFSTYPTYSFFLFFCRRGVSFDSSLPFFHVFLNSNPLALSAVMHFQKADWIYLCEEASCASLLSRHCESVSLPGVSLALFRTLSFPRVYGPLSTIRKLVEMLFESLLGTRRSPAIVRGFT